jgi:hypothetical protein
VRRLAGVISLSGLLAVGCGGTASPPPVGEQLQHAIEHVVAIADARAHVEGCTGPADGGQGRYVCTVDWPRGGGPPVLQVRVDEHGAWRTDELPYAAGSGGRPMGSVSGRGLRLP